MLESLLGNLNVTVLTTREDYSRPKNLQWIVNTMNSAFGLTLNRTARDDIFLDTFKVTGSASRLERLYAYHHFTLLIDANLTDLRQSLKSVDQTNIKSKATSSVRSSVVNLSERNAAITYEKAIDVLVPSFFQWTDPSAEAKYEYVDPLSVHDQIKDFETELKSQKFIFDVTPPFVYAIENGEQSIEMTVENGIITQVKDDDLILDAGLYVGKTFHSVYDRIQKLKAVSLSK
jgi:lipoate-protein ligase A